MNSAVEVLRKPVARRLLWLLAVAALGAVIGALGLQMAGTVAGDAGPGVVKLGVRIDNRARTELLVPPFGSISALTHRAPLTVSVQVSQVDVAQLEDLVGDRRAEARLRSEIEADLGSLARHLFVRCLLVAALAGAVVGALVPRRRWTSVLVGSVGGLLGAGALLWSAWASFDASAFDEPRFEGAVSEAPRIIATARKYVDDFEAVRGRIGVLSAQIRDLYATSLTEQLASGPGRRRILHVSDIHLNPLGVEVIRELADQFDVDAVLDTGDITSFGHPLEGQFGELLDNFDVPYYLVPGNHDSAANREALGRFANVTVVDGEVVDIAGVRVLGIAHPSFTADNRTSEEEVERDLAAQGAGTAELVGSLRPDVLALHDARGARASFGHVPLVLAGHVHRRSWKRIDDTLVLTVGTSGATGLGALTVDTNLAYEAAVLYFDGPDLVAVDNVALRGTNGDFRIDRRLVSEPNDALARGRAGVADHDTASDHHTIPAGAPAGTPRGRP